MKQQTALTTGGNSGIGLATAIELARCGYRSVATARSPAKAQAIERAAAEANVDVETVQLDVTDAEGCVRVIEQVRPDALINNAGFSVLGAVEDVSDEEARLAFETMVLAPMRLARLASVPMRERGRGRIVNLSSIYGFTSTPFTGWYQGCKHALEGLSDALRMELAGDDIEVVLIEPGGVRTNIWEENEREVAKRKGSRFDSAYQRTLSSTRTFEPLMGTAENCAKVIATACTARSPQARYLVGLDARLVAAWSWATPTRIKDQLNRLTLQLGSNRR